MKKKKVNAILKGVAGVSLTLGGVSALSDANLVYAMADETDTSTVPGNESKPGNESTTETGSFNYLDETSNATCTMSTVAADMAEAAADAQKTAEGNTPSDSNGGSVIDSETQKQELNDLKGNLKGAIETSQNLVNKYDQAAGAGKVGGNYYGAADQLVVDLVKYYAAEEGFGADGTDGTVGTVEVEEWQSHGINGNNNFEQNHLETTYKDKEGDIIDRIYYDYVNADKDGNILKDSQSKGNVVDHIVVYEKTPIFAMADNESETFSFKRDDFRKIYAYIINDQEIEVKVDDNGDRYIELQDESGYIVKATVSVNDDSGYTVTQINKTEDENGGNTDQTTSLTKTYKKLIGFEDKDGVKGKTYEKDPEKQKSSSGPTTPETQLADTNQTELPVVLPVNNTGSSESSASSVLQPDVAPAEIIDEDVPLADVPDDIDEDIDMSDEQDVDDPGEGLADLEDEEVPLAVLPDEPMDISDEDVPLADLPDEDVPLADLSDEDVPLAELPDADVPLSDNPETGDGLTAAWVGAAAASVAGLFGASRKKDKNRA